MITSERITVLREVGDIGWLTCLRAAQITKLANEDRPLQLSLFDEIDLAQFAHPGYPGERLIVCRNLALAFERSRRRTELLGATEHVLAPIVESVESGCLAGSYKIGLKVSNVINEYKMDKHFQIEITDTTLEITRKHPSIGQGAALDVIYVIRTTLKESEADSGGVVSAHKELLNVEWDFHYIKVDNIDLHPIHHYFES